METPIVSPVLSAKRAAQKSVIPSKRPPEESRQRHNQMMRENRSRFNNKFKELTDLLDIFKEPGCDYKPMKNKIQILERAIYQYAQMEAKHDRYHKELMFSPDNPDHVPSEYLSVFAAVPALTDACDLLMQYMCSMHAWKYGEAWILKPTDHHSHSADSSAYQLSSVFVAKNNMPDTRQALQQYAQNSSTHRIDQFILSQAFQDHPIWIPNLTAKHTTNLRTEHAKDAKLGTTLVIPIRIKQASGTHPDAVLTLMHVNDDLLSYQNDVRPYDSVSITTALDLVAAVAKSRTKESA